MLTLSSASSIPRTVILLNLHINQRILIIPNPPQRIEEGAEASERASAQEKERGRVSARERESESEGVPPLCGGGAETEPALVIYINPIIAWRFPN